MKRSIIFFICLLLSALPLSVDSGWYYAGSDVSVNDFSGDANCVALWKFENGALTTDSEGNNTLTDHGTVSTSTTDYKEGSASADFVSGNGEYFSITDTDLDPGFPFRAGDGTPGDDISICFWLKADIIGNSDYLFAKYDIGLSKRTFAILFNENKIRVAIGHSGGTLAQNHDFGTNAVTGKWYHVGVTFQNGDSDASSVRIRIWDDNAGTQLGTDYTTSSAKTINIEDAALCIADREGDADKLYDGHKDELVVFKDILSAAEIDKIRAGIYP